MRSRTEMVTNTIDGSDFEEDTDFEDSEEDWRPEKGESKGGLKRKPRDIITGSGSGGRRGGRGSGPKRGRKAASRPARKPKSPENTDRSSMTGDDDDDDQHSSSEPDTDDSSASPARKRGRKPPNKRTPSHKSGGGASTSKDTKQSPTTSEAEGTTSAKSKPIQRKVVNITSSFPDKAGILKLYVFKDDLREGIRDNLKVSLWRRDGSSLLQKYFRDKTVTPNTPQFTSSMVYSCWEDKRAGDYMEVKVRCIEQSRQLRVQVMDVDATERRAKQEYEEYLASNTKRNSSSSEGDRKNGNASTKTDDHNDDETEEYGDDEEAAGEEEDEAEAEDEGSEEEAPQEEE